MNSERNIIKVLELNFLFFIRAVPHCDIYEKKQRYLFNKQAPLNYQM